MEDISHNAKADANETEFMNVVNEIEQYLKNFPDACDTTTGIAKWWVTKQRIEVALNQVNAALEYLVERKRIEKITTPENIVRYRGVK